jgi:hypothetical protein
VGSPTSIRGKAAFKSTEPGNRDSPLVLRREVTKNSVSNCYGGHGKADKIWVHTENGNEEFQIRNAEIRKSNEVFPEL